MSDFRRGRGFSLVEILVAVALLSALIIPVVNLLRASSTNVARTAAATRALLLAQLRVEQLLLVPFDDLRSLPEECFGDDGFRLSVAVEVFEGDERVKQIGVLLRWNDGAARATRSLGLRVLRCRREGQ